METQTTQTKLRKNTQPVGTNMTLEESKKTETTEAKNPTYLFLFYYDTTTKTNELQCFTYKSDLDYFLANNDVTPLNIIRGRAKEFKARLVFT